MQDPERETPETENQPVEEPKTISHHWPFRDVAKLLILLVILYVLLTRMNDVGTFFGKVYSVIQPFAIGGLIALFLNPLMNGFVRFFNWLGSKLKLKPHQKATSIIALILTCIAALLLVYLIANSIIPQVAEALVAIVKKLYALFPDLISSVEKLKQYGINTDPIVEKLSSFDLEPILTKVMENAMGIVESVVSRAGSIISGTFTGLLSFIFAVYVLATKKELSSQLKRFMYAYFKKNIADRAVSIGTLTVETFSSFISGKFLDAILLGLLMFISMTIFGFPYALITSVLVGVTALIPYIGAFLGGAFGVLVMIANDPFQALLFLILFIVVQQIDANFIYPRIVGSAVGLPAIWTFAAIIIGNSLLGVIGMIIFIPIFSVLYSLIGINVSRRLKKRGIEIGDEPIRNASGRKMLLKPETRKKISAWFGKVTAAVGGFFRRLFHIKPKETENPADGSAPEYGETENVPDEPIEPDMEIEDTDQPNG